MAREEVNWLGVLLKVVVVVAVLGTVALVMMPSLGPHTISRNENAAVGALRTYLGAQAVFHRSRYYGQGEDEPLQYANPWNGSGFPDLHQVGGPDSRGTELKLIDLAFADAILGGTPRAGYHLCDILGDEKGPYDFTKQFGLCAFPNEYGRTGRYTYIVDETGTVYYKNLGGFPVNIFPDVERDGWVAVGSDDAVVDEEPQSIWHRTRDDTVRDTLRRMLPGLSSVVHAFTSNESYAVSTLRTYLGAQNQFHRTDFYGLEYLVYANPWNGSGFPDLYEVGGVDSGGTLLKLIDHSFARAEMGGESRAGYYFCDMLGDKATGPYDFSIDCGLCAFPAERRFGRNTFIIDAMGTVYQKDTHGWPVWIYPADPKAEGWLPVGGP
jgi:type II secretory pathway pseudopilin PulG